MELKGKDMYRAECGIQLSDDHLRSLFSLYQPLIGSTAVSLYMTLYSESYHQRSQESHSRLSLIMNLSADDLERARIRLEEYGLLRTWVSEADSRNTYLYELAAPMRTEEFLADDGYMTVLAANIERRNLEVTAHKLREEAGSRKNYTEITRPAVKPKADRSIASEIQYTTIRPKYRFSDDDTAINFDYENFIATTSTLVFPAELRTQENLKLIGKLATVHGLSVDRMRILVSRCVDINTMTFDADKLKYMAEKTAPDVTQAKDPYDLPPVSFLQAKQNGAAVSLSDRKLLEHLSVDMQFPPDVINVMIEYILKKSQNRLVKAFVDMVAGEWARDGVTTREQAFAETRKQTVSYRSTKKEDVLPEYMSRDMQNNSEERSAEEIEALMKGLKKS